MLSNVYKFDTVWAKSTLLMRVVKRSAMMTFLSSTCVGVAVVVLLKVVSTNLRTV